MRSETRADQVQRIIHELAALPGSQALDVTLMSLPRLGPAEAGTPYQVKTRSFEAARMPESVAVPADCEEVIIKLHGALEQQEKKDAMLDELNAFFNEPDYHDNWDVRTHFGNGGDPKHHYELMVFSTLPPAKDEQLA